LVLYLGALMRREEIRPRPPSVSRHAMSSRLPTLYLRVPIALMSRASIRRRAAR